MPNTLNEISTDQLNEIPIAILSVMAMFLLLIIIGVFFMVRYQKKKFQYQQHIFEIQKENEAAILQSQLEIQEQTFNAISQEIHDNVGQILSLAKVQLNIVQSQITDPTGILKESKENIGRAMTDLRDIAKSLSTDRISQLDLVQAIIQEGERINKTKLINCVVEVTGESQYIGTNKKLVIFRLVQETLNNVLKHAGASHILINIQFGPTEFEISVKDDGKGFEISGASLEGLGLQNIERRTALIGGRSTIDSTSGKGTLVQLNIPYE